MNGRSRRFLILALVPAVLACSAALWADPPSSVGRLNLIEGSVSFRPGTLDEWGLATLNYPLTTGDHLWTEAGARAELHLGSAAVRLGAGTDFAVLFLDDQTVQLGLSQGALDVRLRDLQADQSFEIATPGASISLLEPGSYRIDVQADGATDIVVRSGQAELAASSSSVTITANEYASLPDPSSRAFAVSVAPAPDQWELWCLQRDQSEDRYASSQYVPDTMVGYEDLDRWGSWQLLPDYGTAWRPRGVPPGWVPYHFGRWAWVEPWGWTWIDEAPWGFAPFHYGRWVCLTGVWFWLPGAFVSHPIYAPALVVFIGGADWGLSFSFGEAIGWFPLGPHEVYVPPYGASDAYVRNINAPCASRPDAGRIDVRRARYANRSVRGAITVERRQDFLRAEPVARAAVRVGEADLDSAPVRGMGPSLAPERDSILGRPLGAGPSAPRPPASALDRPLVVRHAPPPERYPQARQAEPPEQPGFREVNPPRRQPLVQLPEQRLRREPPSPDLRQPAQAPAAGPRQPPALQQKGVQGQERFAEPRQPSSNARPLGPETRQNRQGPTVLPETRRNAKRPASSRPHRVRRLVDGPNGPVWEWVEEDEAGGD
jgi:hypothetical protein